MQKFKKLLNYVFIDGLGGMALGLFATLIVGTIIQQIGSLIGGNVGQMIFLTGKALCRCDLRGHRRWRCL